MKLEDIKLVTKAIEFAYFGVDISTVKDFNMFYNTVTKKMQARTSHNVKHITVLYDDACVSFMQHYYGPYARRHSADKILFVKNETHLTPEETETVVGVNIKMLKEVMTALYRNDVTHFDGIPVADFDTELLKEMEEEAKNWKYNAKVSCKMIETLSKENTRQNLEVMLTVLEYPEEVSTAVLQQFDKVETDFEIKGFEDFEIIDNRMYIPLNRIDKNLFSRCTSLNNNVRETDYIVISRNPYDFFFCSWGSAIQTCFSLNSPHIGGYGMYPFAVNKGCFIVYGTHGRGTETAVIDGKKWKCPHMSWRCWAWLDTDNRLRLDRLYPVLNCDDGNDNPYDDSYRDIYNGLFEKLFHYSFEDNHPDEDEYEDESTYICLKYADDYKNFLNKYSLYCYIDSLGESTGNYYGVCHGYRNFMGSYKPKTTPLDLLKRVKGVDKNFTYSAQYFINSVGILAKMKQCPITKLVIPDSMEKSFYSKYFKEPINSLLVVSFCDGHVKLDDTTIKNHSTGPIKVVHNEGDYYSHSSINTNNTITLSDKWSIKQTALKTFKDHLQQKIKDSPFDYILLRVIENDRVQYIKYRR